MNPRQKAFAEHYARTGNATEAAKAAGYSAKTAYSAGARLLKNVEVQQYIRQLQADAEGSRIASMTAVKEYWTATMNSTEEKTADRLKASELLARSAGAFLHLNPEHDGEVAFTREYDDGSVVIYVPKMLTEEECRAQEGETP